MLFNTRPILWYLVLLIWETCEAEVTIISTNLVSEYSEQLMAEQAALCGFNHVPVHSLQHVISTIKDLDDTVVLVNNTVVLLNNNTLSISPNTVVTAASTTCRSSTDICNRVRKSRGHYVDSRILIGHSADIAKLFSNMQSDLQDHVEESSLVSVDRDYNVILDIDQHYKDVALQFEENKNTLKVKDKIPGIVTTSAGSKDSTVTGFRFFNEISRYVGNGVTRTSCNTCKKSRDQEPASLFIVLHISKNTGFISNLLSSIDKMKYNKSKVEIVVLCTVESSAVSTVLQAWSPAGDIAKYTLLLSEDFEDEDHDSRYYLLSMFKKSSADFYVYIDSSVYITPSTIPLLIKYNRSVVSPLLTLRNGTSWANFWGSYTPDWSYKRSSDYANIFTATVKGLYKVPCIRNMYIVRRDVALQMYKSDVYDSKHLVPDISMCKSLAELHIPMFIDNTVSYGWLKSELEGTGIPSDLALFEPQHQNDWNMKYRKFFSDESIDAKSMTEPCSKVYRTKVFKPVFGADLIRDMENLGTWKIRLGKYQHSIELNNTKLNSTLTDVIYNLTRDLVPELFPGYKPRGVLYDSHVFKATTEKPPKVYSRSHNHLAAFHVLVPLNQPDNKTLTGGGHKFVRQNCTISDYQMGEMYIFPGWITHYRAVVLPDSGAHYFLQMSFDPPN